ncbi:MAG: hypothetical protein P8Z41_03460 [Anaerolineales bacterium]
MVVRRLLEGLLTAWAAVTVTFFALHLTAGDPLSGLLSRGLATSEQIETLRVNLGSMFRCPSNTCAIWPASSAAISAFHFWVSSRPGKNNDGPAGFPY